MTVHESILVTFLIERMDDQPTCVVRARVGGHATLPIFTVPTGDLVEAGHVFAERLAQVLESRR